MALDLQYDCVFSGPALPLPFVTLNLEGELNRLRLLPKAVGDEARQLTTFWQTYRNHLRQLVSQGLSIRIRNQVIDPLTACNLLGYKRIEAAEEVRTREGRESGGAFLVSEDGARLRFWTVALNEDLDAPARRGQAYRFSHTKIASRVLLESGERLGLLTNGSELRLLICDPARLDSSISISLDGSWKRAREVPDSFRLFVALAKPEGVRALPELVEKARLQQAKVTKDLRLQARVAVEEFIQAVIDAPENQATFAAFSDQTDLGRKLWREGLVTVYRLLFILKLESTDDPAKCFSFASGSLWRNSFSPGIALARHAVAVLERGEHTGSMLEQGLRSLFRMFESGLQCTELNVKPMGGSLFAPHATPILSSPAVRWPEHGVARLLDRLLRTSPQRGAASRERVHYGTLDVEDLGRVYEALLELDPGIATEPMCRLRRAKLEVVVPIAQGERYRHIPTAAADEDNEDEAEPEEEETTARTKATKVEWIGEIPAGRFYLRVGLGRKATGSFYTPHSFVRFLVRETLGPLVERVSPRDDPQPAAILRLRVVDKAMGSGHFLVEAARFLGDALYEACRSCDELANTARGLAEAFRTSGHIADAEAKETRVADLVRRVEALPDPDEELLRYLPSRAVEGGESGFSQRKAVVLCRRMIAVHCLYGVDKNPLAVELAKLALWIECHAEGLPLTFLDHRLVAGDSLTGPFFEHLLKYPGSQQPLDDLFTHGLTAKLAAALTDALQHVRVLESSVGATVADLEVKQAAKRRLDRALAPFKLLAAAWSGGVMLGSEECDDTAYAVLARTVAETGDLPTTLDEHAATLRAMLATGLGRPDFPPCTTQDEVLAQLNSSVCVPALSYDLAFPEVFYPGSGVNQRKGFDADLGNPPWEGIDTSNEEFFAAFDFSILELKDDRDIQLNIRRLMGIPEIQGHRESYEAGIIYLKRAISRNFKYLNQAGDRASAATPDLYQGFVERTSQVLAATGRVGVVLPSAVHANESAAGIRSLLLEQMSLFCCFSFENLRKLFEIDSRMKFALIIAGTPGPTVEFSCAFYLHDDEWLFQPDKGQSLLHYTPGFLRQTTGDLRNFLELRSADTVPIAHTMYRANHGNFGLLRRDWHIFPTEELHTSKQRHRTRSLSELAPDTSGDARLPDTLQPLIAAGVLPICKGEHFRQFDSLWNNGPKVATTVEAMRGKEQRLMASRYYRMAFRRQARSNDERTVISFLSPPGLLYFDSALPERDPDKRASWRVLVLVALANSYPFDWIVRQLVAANVTFNFLDTVPVPCLDELRLFIAHQALRLSSQHAGYAPLWREQLGEAWREARPAFEWPVLSGDNARWVARAAIDAVVANAYGLPREQYAHVLGTFSHSSYKDAPRQCLAAFDELLRDGLESFTRNHDPYWDIPLNESLPQPVITIPLPATEAPAQQPVTGELFAFETTPGPAGSGRLFTEQPVAPARRRDRPRPSP